METKNLLSNTTTSKMNYPKRITALLITLFFISLNVTAQDSLREFLNTKTEKSAKTYCTLPSRLCLKLLFFFSYS